MKPTEPPSGGPSGQDPAAERGSALQGPSADRHAPHSAVRRPATGGGPTYRHPIEAPEFGEPHEEFHHDTLVRPHGGADNPDVGHEHSDVNVRALIMSAVVLVVVTVAAHLVIYFMFGWLERGAAANDPQISPLARPTTNMPRSTTGSPVFNEPAAMSAPQLLTNEPMALERHQADIDKRLHGFGWVDQKAGVAHISIEQAKKLIVERGLPARADGAVPPNLGARLPAAGEGSGGRAITVPLPEPPAGRPAQAPAEKH